MGDVHFDNRAKRNIMKLLHAFLILVLDYDRIFPYHVEAATCKE